MSLDVGWQLVFCVLQVVLLTVSLIFILLFAIGERELNAEKKR